MTVVYLVVLVVLGALLLLAIVGGALASRRNRAGADAFAESLASVDRQLAHAVAADRGWERDVLEDAARRAFAERRPGETVARLELVQVVDEPGTEHDLAVFRVVTGATPARTSRLTLGRRDGAWHAVALEDER
jgi:hypothetical protein